MSIILRPLLTEDLDEILPIERKAHAHPWTPGIFADCIVSGYNCWVLEENGCVIAYGVLQIAVGEAHLLNITVMPARQREGLGRRLLNDLIEVARGKADALFLEVRPSNIRAIGLYQSMGFNEIGVRRNYYPGPSGGREDALMMALAL